MRVEPESKRYDQEKQELKILKEIVQPTLSNLDELMQTLMDDAVLFKTARPGGQHLGPGSYDLPSTLTNGEIVLVFEDNHYISHRRKVNYSTQWLEVLLTLADSKLHLSYPTPARPIPSCSILSRPIPPHPIPFHTITAHPIPPHPTPFHDIPSHPAPCHSIPSHPNLIPLPFYPIPPHPIPFCPIPSQRFPSAFATSTPNTIKTIPDV